MGLKTGCVVTVWSVEDKGKYSEVRVSTSRKNKTTQNWETDFGAYARFIGAAHEAAKALKPKDRIKITEFEVTNRYDKERKITYTSYAVFGFEPLEPNERPAPAPTGNDDMPF